MPSAEEQKAAEVSAGNESPPPGLIADRPDVTEFLQGKMPQEESLRAQLDMLQTRIGLHGSRLWQLPLTYLGVLVVSLSQFNSPDTFFAPWFVFSSLAVFGAFLLWCMYGAFEGYQRTGKHMIRIEKQLNLVPTTAIKLSHYAPYFGILTLGIAFMIGAAIYFYASQSSPQNALP